MKSILILATSNNAFADLTGHNGLHRYGAGAFDILHDAGLWFGPRSILEETEKFRQILPYMVLKVGNKYVSYRRGKAGTEARLHGSISIGLGGHVDLADAAVGRDGRINLRETINRGVTRELREEIGFDNFNFDTDITWLGLVVDNNNAVGRVHIGLVGVLCVPMLPSGGLEDSINDFKMRSLGELHSVKDKMEGWSALVLDALK